MSLLTKLIAALALALAATVAVGQTGLGGIAQGANDFLPVTEAYQLEVEQVDDQRIRLYWQIADNYYLYQHRFKAVLEDASGTIESEFEFAPALQKTDEFFGEVQVYYTNADLALITERAFGLARLAITSQGCADAGLCYPPHTEVFTLNGATGEVLKGEPVDGLGAAAPVPAADPTAPAGAEDTDPAPLQAETFSLFAALLFAFLGGLILNAMPCVFPILSLKVLSFATGDPESHHRHAWWYLAGVVASFVSVAAVLISLQGAGQLIGWGFQLQSPGFVIALAYLFTAMALSLSGLVQFGGGLMNLGNNLAGKGGAQGSFFTGVLAVVVASPCTAPFMGSALGFALTQPAAIALLVFVALGVGMAFPMVLLSYSPAARRALPKPGAWMETLKEVLAFPLYATAVWLLWVAGKQAGVDTMAAALAGLVMLALGLYLFRGSLFRKTLALLSLAIAIGLATYRGAVPVAGSEPRAEGTVAWSEQALEGLRSEGVPVFVDVTADWCITCLANEQAVLFADDTRQAFAESGVVYMIADWTNYDADIGAFVKSHGRNGIPLYVMYPPDPDKPPFLLPQLLTRNMVRDALARVTTN